MLRSVIGDGLDIAAQRRGQAFSFSGPLSPPNLENADEAAGGAWLNEMTARAGADWTGVNAYGFHMGAGVARAKLKRGEARFDPIDLAASGGRLTASPTLKLTTDPMEMLLPRGPLLTRVRITPEMCNQGLKFIAPVLAGVTQVQGEFSIDVDGCRIPLSDPKTTEMAGQMTVHAVDVAPGPMLVQVAQLIDVIRIASGQSAKVASQLRVAHLRRESKVKYRMVKGRVYHRDLQLQFGDVTVSTYGSVGLDESLAIVAHVNAPKLFERLPGGAALAAKGLKIPINGTLSQPKIDRKSLKLPTGKLLESLLQDKKVNDTINKGREKLLKELNRGLEKLFGPGD